MKTWMKYGIAVITVLVAAVLFVSFGWKKEEGYRNIKVMSIKGTATVEREGLGTLDAYEDMKLENGDRLSVDSESSLIISMDDDKYAMLEPGSSLTLEADGTKENSRTVIHLEAGAVMNYLTQKLSEESSYEVTVPNSTMAVRGTVFRVAIVYEGVDSYTTVQVFEGVVGSRLIFPDGSIDEEEVQITPGREVLIHGNTEISEYVGDKGHDIDYTKLNRVELEFLLFCIDHGANLCLTREEIEELLRRLDQPQEEPGKPAAVKKPKTPEKKPVVIETPVPIVPEPESGHSHSSSSGGPSNEEEDTSHHSKKKDKQNETPDESKDESKDDTKDDTTEETPKYTVTFKTPSGAVFCTQTVEEGKTATKPALLPTPSGSWNYDFTKAVTENIIITWSEG